MREYRNAMGSARKCQAEKMCERWPAQFDGDHSDTEQGEYLIQVSPVNARKHVSISFPRLAQ